VNQNIPNPSLKYIDRYSGCSFEVPVVTLHLATSIMSPSGNSLQTASFAVHGGTPSSHNVHRLQGKQYLHPSWRFTAFVVLFQLRNSYFRQPAPRHVKIAELSKAPDQSQGGCSSTCL
jgi:hypothetical protein